VWELPDFPQYGDTVGREAIVALWLRAVADHRDLVYVATPGAIEVDGERATVRLYTSEVYASPHDGRAIRRRGRYDDELVKRDGRWYIARQRFTMLHEE
jgi:SnoaL-like domain